MAEIIASAVVQLARYALFAYAIRHGRDVLIHWLDRLPAQPTDQQLIDAVRVRGLDLEERKVA